MSTRKSRPVLYEIVQRKQAQPEPFWKRLAARALTSRERRESGPPGPAGPGEPGASAAAPASPESSTSAAPAAMPEHTREPIGGGISGLGGAAAAAYSRPPRGFDAESGRAMATTRPLRSASTWFSRGNLRVVLGWPELVFTGLALVALLVVAYRSGYSAGMGFAKKPVEDSGLDRLMVGPEAGQTGKSTPLLPGARGAAKPVTAVTPGAPPTTNSSGVRAPLGAESVIPPAPRGPAVSGKDKPKDAMALPVGASPGGASQGTMTTGSPAVTDKTAKAGGADSAAPPLPPMATKPAVTLPPPIEKFEFDPEARYLVVQHFRNSALPTAEKAREFLAARGIECVLVGGSDVRLIAIEPFRISKDAAGKVREKQLQELRKRILDLGKEFNYDHGYSFDLCRDQKLK